MCSRRVAAAGFRQRSAITVNTVNTVNNNLNSDVFIFSHPIIYIPCLIQPRRPLTNQATGESVLRSFP